MGCYINPEPPMTKEKWLIDNAEQVSIEKLYNFDWAQQEKIPVCLVYNAVFTAAAVLYSKNEFEVFADPSDLRHKRWFIVDVKKVRDVAPIDMYK